MELEITAFYCLCDDFLISEGWLDDRQCDEQRVAASSCGQRTELRTGDAEVTKFCRAAFAFFCPNEQLASLTPLGSGRVNDTWLAVTAAEEKYVLQRLNPAVFTQPALVQANLCLLKAASKFFKSSEVLREKQHG